VAIIASILFIWGLAPAIGKLGGGELGGEGGREGVAGIESRSGVGNKRGFKEKTNKINSAGAPLCIGVVKSAVVPGLHRGTTSEERGVTRISPSNPRPGGGNSAGTLPKFKKRETSEGGLLRNRGGEKGVLIEGDGGLPISAMETSSAKLFPLLRTTSGSTLGVARGICG
jgi:hypothetical protein